MAKNLKIAPPASNETGLWLYLTRGKKPQLELARFRYCAGDRLAEIKADDSNNGFRWDKAIKAFCMLCVHYVIHSSDRAPIAFEDDPREKDDAVSLPPDAAESLNNKFGDSKPGWHKTLFDSEHGNVRAKLFRGENSDGKTEKPLTRIRILQNLLPPEKVRIFHDGKLLTHKNDKLALCAILSGLRQQEPDFRSFKGLPDDTKCAHGQDALQSDLGVIQPLIPPAPIPGLPTPSANSSETKFDTAPFASALVSSLNSLPFQSTTQTPPELPPQFSDHAVFPFHLILPSSLYIRKAKLAPYVTTVPELKDVHYEEMPHLSPFANVKGVLDNNPYAVIRGTKGSGRTTMAMQLAGDFMHRVGQALYLDLATTPITTESFPSLLKALAFISKAPCLIIVDNMERNAGAATHMCKAWSKTPGKSKLLLVDLWAPLSKSDAEFPLALHEERSTNLYLLRDDFIRVFCFWRNCDPHRGPRLFRHPLKIHHFGGSLSRLCNGLDTSRRASWSKHGKLEIYNSGDIVEDLRDRFPTLLEDYLADHHRERACCGSFRDFYRELLQDNLSKHQKLLDAYSRLNEHMVLKWHYLMEKFDLAVSLLERAQIKYPPLISGYSQALEQDEQFSFKMASRIMDPEYCIMTASYVSFAEQFLPIRHKAHIIECLYNAGPLFLTDNLVHRTTESLLSFGWFIHRWLPKEFLEGLSAWCFKPYNQRRLQWWTARKAVENPETFGKIRNDPMMPRFVDRQVLENIALNPDLMIQQLGKTRPEDKSARLFPALGKSMQKDATQFPR